jgi:hypothetical protein
MVVLVMGEQRSTPKGCLVICTEALMVLGSKCAMNLASSDKPQNVTLTS